MKANARCFLLLLSLVLHCAAHKGVNAARSIHLRFIPMMGDTPLLLYDGDAADNALRISMFRCYISHITTGQAGDTARLKNNARLLDASDAKSLSIELPYHDGDRLMFLLGIDSATSCSGVHGGELDPARGMYWAWQSGYINFKLEGFSPVSTARKHAFHFHLGGYQAPFQSARMVSLPLPASPGSEDVIVRIDLQQFLDGIDLARQNSIMIPGAEAVALSSKASRIFRIQ